MIDEGFFVEVDHTIMDFRYLILGQKLQVWNGKNENKFVFDDFKLADLLDSMTHHPALFTKSSV